ncbi:MAG: hypothetical protein A2174_03530 [Candidatus Portnoybacteria bacterium RBG_13_41_18]|uniref:Response regulatory domain-containing protein n=1 Tax=Candidatus Portnoybacteria bacterium RBG_13_41_18 TaxID=1801991 RepID=A0A1G2F842_9BACT|nr:MAG: hypothetical protein A2174_03530 [Candidatus Portnoybacteria bacterium RBG_13_41_18]
MKKILVVDDDLSSRDSFRILLEDIGYKVLMADDGLTGVEVFKQGKPDLVVSDYNMPVMDGVEMSIKIRRLDPSAKFIISSGASNMRKEVEGLGFGFFAKGKDSSKKLLALIEDFLPE